MIAQRLITWCTASFVLAVLLHPSVCGAVSWESAVKLGFDSNVNRAITNPQDDFYLLGSLSVNRLPSGESRLDWILSANVEGAAYDRHKGLNYGLVNIASGVVYVLNRSVTLTASPYVEAKAVQNSDQSAFTAGGKLMLREVIGDNSYLGQYYLIRTSFANVSTYSFTENAVGVFAGTKLFTRLTGEVGYEYSYGDSYLTLGPTGGGDHGKGHNGKPPRESGPQVVREPVHRHAIGANASLDWTGAFSSTIGYMYTSMVGRSGTALSHTAFISLNYRF